MFLTPVSPTFLSCFFSRQLHHWLSDRPHLHPALWKLLCEHVRWLLRHSSTHHRCRVRNLQCVVAVRSRQVTFLFTLWVSDEISDSPRYWMFAKMFPGFLTTSMPCWAGVPMSFINTCGSTSACCLCWDCLELPPSACLFIPRLTELGTRKRCEAFYFCRKFWFLLLQFKNWTASDGSTTKHVELQ